MTTKNTCSIYVKGKGYSLESHQLKEPNARDLFQAYQNSPSDFANGSFVTDNGILSDETNCDYIYGVDPLDMTCSWNDNPDAPAPIIKQENIIREAYITDANPKNMLEYHQICSGKLFGYIELPISSSFEYNPDLLRITYIEFAYDGWPERYGRIISSISYDDQELEMDWEDNGLDVDNFLLGYEYDGDEFEEYAVIYESHADKVVTDFQWDKLDTIFK
ncbi:MAG: hypothetical protein VW683_15120 [Betaproteobacteria bacterium]|jgi:hypothetical protein